MLEEWRSGVKYNGFCHQIGCAVIPWALSINELPELWAQKPKCNYQRRSRFHTDKRRVYTAYWWEPYSATKRIEALEKAIRMVRPQVKPEEVNFL